VVSVTVVLVAVCRRLNKYIDINKEHSCAVSILSQYFHPEGRCLIPEQATGDKALGQVCLQAPRCASVIIIPTVTHTYKLICCPEVGQRVN
jgi:hypothetical protein